jgi:hypothetical protein
MRARLYSHSWIILRFARAGNIQQGQLPSELIGDCGRCRVPHDCPRGVADLVDACLSQKASARPSATAIVELLEGDPRVLETPRTKVYDPEEHSEVTLTETAANRMCA